MSEEAQRARAQRAMLEQRLAWKDEKPKVNLPTKPKRIKYLSDQKEK